MSASQTRTAVSRSQSESKNKITARLDFVSVSSKPTTVPPVFQVGVTTDEIDFIAHQETIKHNAYPSPLRYGGFPKSVCTSVNNVVCHGIPDR